MPDSSDARKIDTIERWLRDRGVRHDWVGLLRGHVSFKRGSDGDPPTYSRGALGGYITLPPDCFDGDGELNPMRIESLLHEAWHAYCELYVERNIGGGRRVWDGILMNTGTRQVRPQVPAGGETAHAVDEVIGNYLSLCMERIKITMPNVRDEATAQRYWDELMTPAMRTIDLSGREYKKIAATYVVPPDVARLIRTRTLGLPDRVSQWPPEARTWPRAYSRQEVQQYLDRLTPSVLGAVRGLRGVRFALSTSNKRAHYQSVVYVAFQPERPRSRDQLVRDLSAEMMAAGAEWVALGS